MVRPENWRVAGVPLQRASRVWCIRVSGVSVRNPGFVGEAPVFLDENGEEDVVVGISMCNRSVDCVGSDWTIYPVRVSPSMESEVRHVQHWIPSGIVLGDRRPRLVIVAPSEVEEVAHGADALHRVADAGVANSACHGRANRSSVKRHRALEASVPVLELHHAPAEEPAGARLVRVRRHTVGLEGAGRQPAAEGRQDDERQRRRAGRGGMALGESIVRSEGMEQAGAYRTGSGLSMLVAGVRGGLPELGGFALAVKPDAFVVRTSSDALSSRGAGTTRRPRPG